MEFYKLHTYELGEMDVKYLSGHVLAPGKFDQTPTASRSDPPLLKFNFKQPAARPCPPPVVLLRSSSVASISHPLVEQWETLAVAARPAVRKCPSHNKA